MPTNLPETAPPRAPKGRGRPAYTPNETHREQVKAMAGYGIPQEHIAKALHISAPTLRKHYREQLDLSAIDANTNVLTSLFRMATTRHNAAAAIFWAKCRCGFRPGGAAYEEAPKAPPPPAPPAPPLRRSSLEGLTAVLNDGAPNGDVY
jgi:hypothetical protein